MNTSNFFNKDFFEQNRQNLLEQLPPQSVAFVTSADQLPRNGDQTFYFRQSSNLFYLTGINQEQTLLVLSNCHPDCSKHQILFIRYACSKEQIWEGKKLSVFEAIETSGIKNVLYTSDFETMMSEIVYYAENIFIASNENLKYRRFYNDADYRLYKKLRFNFPFHSYKRLSPFIVKQRLIKQQPEIDAIKKAIEITNKAFNRVLKFVKPNVKENEVEAEIMHEFLINGVKNYSFEPIVASGIDTCVLHYTQNNKKCESGDLLLIDFGAEFSNYAADITRTIPVDGKFDKFQLKVYSAVLEIQNYAKNQLKSGSTINIWNKQVKKFVEQKLLELQLITKQEIDNQKTQFQAVQEYFMHGVGHFLGIDVHDVGTNDTYFEPGMVLTVEPGIYIAEKGFGIRLENDVLITNSGIIDLSEQIPIEAKDIESKIY